MEKAIIGKKLGMSQIFAPDGRHIPVTVVEATPNTVIQVKTVEKDGYSAVKVGFGSRSEKNATKAIAAQCKIAGIAPVRVMKEFKLANAESFTAGDKISVNTFAKGDKIDVVGTTRGRGFTGTIQRWNTHCGPKAHGSGYHRGVGSLSANSTPSRVFKLKKMPGQYGSERVTIQNLEIVKVDEARNLILIGGAIPGPKGGIVQIKQSLKKAKASKWFFDSSKVSSATRNPQKESAKAAAAAKRSK